MIIIAIDGHSSCGKSTIAKGLAKKLNYIYVDTGAMYRAVTLFCMNEGLITGNQVDEKALKKKIKDIEISFRIDPETKMNRTLLDGVDVEDVIRGMEVTRLVSPVSAIKFVREEMVEQQRALGVNKGIVMDGRDIGTVVFPKAELKIFVTAKPEVRAQRRHLEYLSKGKDVAFETVLADLQARDHYDTNRKESPLRQAKDALVLDNSEMTIEEQLQWVVDKVDEIIK